jgi:DNA-binding NarL/FixJ family response regulator
VDFLAKRDQLSAEAARLRRESLRLRLEFLNADLELCHTFATLADAKGSMRATCRKAASKGYETITRMIRERLPEEEQRKLAGKVERLRLALDSPEIPEPDGGADSSGWATSDNANPLDDDRLTRREVEVLTLIAKGNSTKELAFQLGITFKTAACHRYHIMEKLGVHETASLVLYAIRRGLVRA